VPYIRDTLTEFLPPCHAACVRTKTLFGMAIGRRGSGISKCTQNRLAQVHFCHIVRNGNKEVNTEETKEIKKNNYNEEMLIEMYKLELSLIDCYFS